MVSKSSFHEPVRERTRTRIAGEDCPYGTVTWNHTPNKTHRLSVSPHHSLSFQPTFQTQCHVLLVPWKRSQKHCNKFETRECVGIQYSCDQLAFCLGRRSFVVNFQRSDAATSPTSITNGLHSCQRVVCRGTIFNLVKVGSEVGTFMHIACSNTCAQSDGVWRDFPRYNDPRTYIGIDDVLATSMLKPLCSRQDQTEDIPPVLMHSDDTYGAKRRRLARRLEQGVYTGAPTCARFRDKRHSSMLASS